jgi:uncharacterized protein
MLHLDDSFRGPDVDARLIWLNAPPSVRLGPAGMTIETRAGSDFWQGTHYGFRVDDGHALLTEVRGDFQLETSVVFEPVHQYDQAGLLVRISPSSWLKTSIEFELEAPSRLGSVVTNAGWSDWATEDVPASLRAATYRVSRRAGDYTIEYAPLNGTFRQLRIAHLHDDDGQRPVFAGIYACSPKGDGFKVTFDYLRVRSAS